MRPSPSDGCQLFTGGFCSVIIATSPSILRDTFSAVAAVFEKRRRKKRDDHNFVENQKPFILVQKSAQWTLQLYLANAVNK